MGFSVYPVVRHNMKKLNILIILISFFLTCCVSKSNSKEEHLNKKTKKQLKLIDTSKNVKLYHDFETASFEIITDEINSGRSYVINEITYAIVYISPNQHYNVGNPFIAKYFTKTEGCVHCEGLKKNIKIELSSFSKPENILFNIEKECHNIELESDIYKTYNYGCCLEQDIYEFLDYNNESIIKSNLGIITGKIPNSKIKFYVGFINDDHINNSPHYSSSMFFSYSSKDKYVIKINSNKKLEWMDLEIDISSDNESDYATNNDIHKEYTFWSLNKIKKHEQINGIVVTLKHLGKKILEIPIVKGKPFGKNNKIHKVIL